jgi:DnaJ-class molecular chaperone
MMIGPAQRRTPCPWCNGTGIEREIERTVWEGTASLGSYRQRIQVVLCDGCLGQGTVTRHAAKEMHETIG